MAAVHTERAVHFLEFACDDHLRGQPSHLCKVGGDSRETAENYVVKCKIVIGNDEDIFAYFKSLLSDPARKCCESPVELGIQNQEGVAFRN